MTTQTLQGRIYSGVLYARVHGTQGGYFEMGNAEKLTTKTETEKKELKSFIEAKGLPGWAPTQGHIPSGVPYVGFLIDDLTKGDKNRAMIVGKGSLFLGRMTNLFDGVSIVIERNNGTVEGEVSGISKDEIRKIIAESMRKISQEMLEE